MKKRWISWLLVLTMVAALMPQMAIEARAVQSGTCGDNLTWVLDDEGTLTISGTGEMWDYEWGDAPWYSSRASIKTIQIDDGVTAIGDCAFPYCSILTSVTIPNGVSSVGESAFDGCASLTSITIPQSVVNIGLYAFSDCRELAKIHVDNSNLNYSSDERGVLFDKDKIKLIQAPGAISGYYGVPDTVKTIAWGAFSSCNSLNEIRISDSVTSIAVFAFLSCSSLTSVTIGNSVETIGDRAFIGCDGLVSITIPNSVRYIGDSAFGGCDGLTSITIPDSVKSIGDGPFESCTNLTEILVDESNPSFSNDEMGVLFNKQKTMIIQAPGAINGTYSIPDTVSTIGDSSFCSCKRLTSILIPYSVKRVDFRAFEGCSGLSDVYYTGTEEQWSDIRISISNERLTNATIHFESEMPDTPVTGYQMHAYGSCRDGAISRGEEMTVVIELCKDGIPLSDWDTPVYTIGDRSIISITKNEKKGDYVYLTVRGVREGKSSLTVTDSRSGAYVAMEIEVRDSDAVPSCFFITNVPRFYPDYLCERNNLTNFYNFNGLYVCDFPYPDDIKKVGGEYKLTFTVYNSTHMYGSVDIFDALGNWKGCERINKHTEITGLWDTAKSAFFLIRDLVATDILSYNAASFSTPTKVTVTVPEGGYITISNNFVESQGTYIYNTVDFLMLGVSLTMDLALGKYELEGVQEQAVNQILQTPDSYKTFMSYYPEIGANIIADLDEKGYGAIVESITLQSFDLFEEMNFDFLGTVDTVLDSAGNVAEEIYVKCTPVALGATLKGMFAVNGALDRLYQAMDISRSENKPYIVLYTPEAAGGLTMSGVTVTPDEGSVTEEAVLQVFRIGNTDAMVISDEGLVVSQYELYNICFTVNDREIQPSGMVTVKIPIPENFSDDKCIVFHQQDDGQWSKVDCWIENGFIVFEVDHFSQFALVDMSTAEPYVCPFTDVPDDSFYYESVMWAVENGITNGATASTFDPGGTCLRAHVVTFLHRADGNPEPGSSDNPFSDVKNTDFFYKPVLWAVENGITNGTSATTFGSFANCNRAAVVTFLWRAAGSPEPESTSNPFEDVNPTDYFYKPVLWAAENGITSGIDATHFGPTGDCNRAQVVTFLYRAYN